MGIEQELKDALDDMFYWGWPKNNKPSFTYTRPTFEVHVGKSGLTWFVPAVTVLPNRADHVYRTAYADTSRVGTGFAGGTIVLPLLDGSDFLLKGGWHSRAEDLLKDTGIDCLNLYKTYGAVGVHRLPGPVSGVYGLLHKDKAPQIGIFHRIETIAQRLANERNERVYYTVASYSGGSAGGINPE
jgi:hypothetical protein